MIKISNFTLHPQNELVEQWRSLGFEMDPAPRMPLLLEASDILSAEQIMVAVQTTVDQIALQGFEAILVGGLTDAMIYADRQARRNGLKVYVAISPKGRDPRTGKFLFLFRGAREVLPLA